MLSIKKLSSASKASHYFEKDDYYAKSSEEAKKDSQWYGRATGALGLSGNIDPDKFKQLLEGKLDATTTLGRQNDGGQSHVPGWDLTFSAPKSVSLLYEIGGDKRLKDAHLSAVKNTLSYMEKTKAVTRQMINGAVKQVSTQNIAAAIFTHHTSRSLDPQLHSHAVILNMTQHHGGEWRSIESLPIFQSKMLLGALYRSELAKSVKALGYEIEQTHSDGRFSIMGVPREVLREFSGRRQEIEEGLKNSHNPDALAAERVALITRKYKSEQNHVQLKMDWEERARVLGFDAKMLVDAADKTIPDNPVNREALADEAVLYAASKQSERESVFTKDALVFDALIHSLGDISLSDVVQAIERNVKDTLVKTSLDGQAAFTTKRAIYLEKANIAMVRDGNHAVDAITNKNFINTALKGLTLTPGQSDAVSHILTTHNRVIGIQGYAGTGKTFMLSLVNKLATEKAFEVKGFGPSASAAKTLEHDASIESVTLAKHLVTHKSVLEGQNNKQLDFSQQLWVVDEASLVSNKDMFDLLKLSELTRARVVLVGDKQQLGAVEAGKPFAYLQESALSVVGMRDILRQEVKELLSAVYDTIKGKFQSAFSRIESNIVEVENKEERLALIAKAYLNSPDRENMLVLAPSNEDRQAINGLIRRGLKRDGTLTGEGFMHNVLVKQGFTDAEKSRVSNYRIGMVLKFNRDFKTQGVTSGDHLIVEGLDVREGVLLLRRSDGHTVRWNAARHGASRGLVEVSATEMREVNKGDVLLWKNNEKRLGLNNGDKLHVQTVTNKQLQVKDGKGNKIILENEKNHHQYFDHHYSSTVYRSQGMTNEHVLMHGEDYRRNLTNQKSFYVGLSRAKQHFKLFVNDKAKYMKAVERNQGEKTSALESINQYKGGRNELLPNTIRTDNNKQQTVKKRTIVKTR